MSEVLKSSSIVGMFMSALCLVFYSQGLVTLSILLSPSSKSRPESSDLGKLQHFHTLRKGSL